jgi:hypothetical protein
MKTYVKAWLFEEVPQSLHEPIDTHFETSKGSGDAIIQLIFDNFIALLENDDLIDDIAGDNLMMAYEMKQGGNIYNTGCIRCVIKHGTPTIEKR